MKRSKKINGVMYKLLIERGIDGFSVIELRNASLAIDGMTQDPDEARKRLYRQIYHFEKNGWLISKGYGRNKRYFVSDMFKAMTIEPKKRHSATPNVSQQSNHYSILESELVVHNRNLEIVLGEIEEYQSLCARFPSLDKHLSTMLHKAYNRSAQLIGKANVLRNLLVAIQQQS
ncbi:hypothetical protein [Vibrio cholerae]|uniref:hypothetical protein n=1 Tax=Vibrio cholerae TaxID=666 RepID=UPI0006E4AFCC|nr:hypothetical protein [Vibrio cholerae]KQA22678.1 hypothetical protein F546_17075 [Vibrio paracholerae 877-163]GHW88369.1 hypothetical protein VCSRO154_3442 [Vibrio metoecus]EGR1020551.1 hypothetical protein [Vibrio cholerae]EGR4071104.1 hypothetical protein [Vibrio cholerae]EGR4117341.1 hypothetical protein [Vibrio cholerae]